MLQTTPPLELQYIVITYWEKVAIACGTFGFFILIVMCMLCILCPEKFCCCCYGNKEDDERPNRYKLGSQKSTSSKSSYGSTVSEYTYSGPDGPPEPGSVAWTPLQVIKEHDTPVSDWSSDNGSRHDVILLDKNKKRIGLLPNIMHNGDIHTEANVTLTSGKIDFALSYLWCEERLVIKVIQVYDVKLSDGQSLVSPYVKIRIYRTPKHFFAIGNTDETSHVMHNMEKEMKTKMRRPSDVLVYKETFDVQMNAESLKNFTFCLLLCDMDKLSRHVTLGETSVVLKKAKLFEVQECLYSEEFHEPIKEFLGVVTVGLCYLPTSEKMYVTIETVKDLMVMDRGKESTDTCVKLCLMYDGKQLKRVKTTVHPSNLNPVFNETFSFDVPQNTVEKVYFSLAVCHYHEEKKKTKMIGRVYLGLNFGQDAGEQWNSMLQNPRKKIVQCYKITN